MDLHVSAGTMGIIITILVHAGAWIWFSSMLATKVDNLVIAMGKIDKELEKRDLRIDKAFDRIDEVRKMIPQGGM